MCSKGWIGYEDAAAMIMGENIGTTITANLAAAVANVQAKRAALAHFIINVFGVIWLFLIFTPFLNFIGDLCVTLHLSTYNPKFSDPKLLNEAFSPEARAGVTASINAAMPLVLSLFNTLAKGINRISGPDCQSDYSSQERGRNFYFETYQNRFIIYTGRLAFPSQTRDLPLRAKYAGNVSQNNPGFRYALRRI